MEIYLKNNSLSHNLLWIFYLKVTSRKRDFLRLKHDRKESYQIESLYLLFTDQFYQKLRIN